MSAISKLLVTPTNIHDVLIIEPKVFGDERGWFTESFNAQDFSIATTHSGNGSNPYK
jgi:dTDP-4-dehydrorhamnose 3,5-epimerase